MEKHYRLSDIEFENQINSCLMDSADFSHEAHLRLAWININKYKLEQAEVNIQNQLKRFVAFAGAKNKYNTTLTIAGLKAVNHFVLKSYSNNFKDFIIEYPRLKYNFKELMEFHYGFDIYNSVRAKVEYLEPDLNPFD